MPRLSEYKRHEVGAWCMEAFQVVKLHTECSVQLNTYQNHPKIQPKCVLEDRSRLGRQISTTIQQDRYIRLQHRWDRTDVRSARKSVGVHRKHFLKTRLDAMCAEEQKAWRHICSNMLTSVRRKNHLKWTQKRRRWSHRKVTTLLGTEETKFHLRRSDGRARVWRRRGEMSLLSI